MGIHINTNGDGKDTGGNNNNNNNNSSGSSTGIESVRRFWNNGRQNAKGAIEDAYFREFCVERRSG